MTVTFEGLDCIADMGSTEYKALASVSQAGRHAWAYQANYAYYVLYYGAVLTFCAIVKYVWYRFDDWSYRNGDSRGSLLKRGIALTRVVGYRRFPVMLSRVTGLPASFGTLVVMGASTLFVLCVCFIPHFYYRACRGFGSPPLAVRAGLQVMALTPYLIIISGKTNFISFVTGVSYEKLNVFHQALGWGSLFLSFVHTIPFLVQPVREGGAARLKELWDGDNNYLYVNGLVALVLLFCLCFLSTRFSRSLCYEVWWHSHWVIGLAYFAILTWHVYGLLDAEQYMWGTLGFWGFQMLYRALVKTTFKPNLYAFKSKKAALNRITNGCYEIVVNIDSRYELDWMPGQHIFIRFMLGIHTLDNHPFSIMTVPEKRGETQLKLIVKPHRGLTRKLYNLIDDKSTELDCYIDGPYGGMCRDPLAFDKLVLMSTGTGVTVTLPFVQYVAQHMSNKSCRVREIEFNWVVTSQDTVEWIQRELESAKESLRDVLRINIFVTNSRDGAIPQSIGSRKTPVDSETSSVSNSSKGEKAVHTDQLWQIYNNCKPNVPEFLSQIDLGSKTAVVCAGTASFQGDCGNACAQLQRRVLKGECDEVYLHTENFGW
ncbi:FRE7 [Cyberlindnera jadinii]|uniref:ferric-chelate reductase (NADPH) n=1 Tax=Cyberlindnera jadinii (strain ATCC 18201 / CBS 1600 / BCRC 20928 / JCM 3617 / NBRC 0987 / NRRL Y-1542) TaxID=983966 RepID=A0A0H5CIM4_CYBJN|nr:FRE7 [Cyberlindnera jadinii]